MLHRRLECQEAPRYVTGSKISLHFFGSGMGGTIRSGATSRGVRLVGDETHAIPP